MTMPGRCTRTAGRRRSRTFGSFLSRGRKQSSSRSRVRGAKVRTLVIFEQFYLGCLAHASYLIGDEATRVAAVVDPQRDIDRYLSFADEHRLRIKHVFLTHFHADFVAGHLEFRNRLGATIYLGKSAKAEYAFAPIGDGDVIEF